jgi:phage gp45-like
MATNNQHKSQKPTKAYSDAGASNKSGPFIGVVKNNIDNTHSGKIEVYIAAFGGSDPDSSKNWTPVSYMSPFIGITSSGKNPKTGPDKSGDGAYLGNPNSYGFWASSPDIGTEVVCIFINGNKSQGYYIGCIPKVGLLQMVPAIGSSSKVKPNDTEAEAYAGANRLPTNEINTANPSVNNSSQPYNETKPVHSYQASILADQGLIRDDIRGVIGSSAQRESPSRVFGISTPGGSIYDGGYNAATLATAIKNGVEPSKLKQLGRTGGHTFVMDDGSLQTGKDQHIRLRTSGGHQITMSDSGETLFIIHANGRSWVELGKEGTVDIYSTNSFNVRTHGDINFHADRDINLQAGRNVNVNADTIKQESKNDYSVRVGGSFSGYTSGSFSFKADASIAMTAGGGAGIKSGGVLSLKGDKVNLNTDSPQEAPTVPPMSKIKHTETLFSASRGWTSASPNLESISTRVPTHQPFIGRGKGLDIPFNGTAEGS